MLLLLASPAWHPPTTVPCLGHQPAQQHPNQHVQCPYYGPCFHPTLPICTSIAFSVWQKRIHYFNTRQILRHLPIDDGNLPNVTCSAKLCVSTHDPDLPKPDPSTKTIYGKKRPSTSSCSSSSGPSASRKPHIITPSHPAPRHNHNPSISRIVNRPIAAPQPLMSLSVPSPSNGSAA